MPHSSVISEVDPEEMNGSGTPVSSAGKTLPSDRESQTSHRASGPPAAMAAMMRSRTDAAVSAPSRSTTECARIKSADSTPSMAAPAPLM